jgi:hypothetical protein
MVLLPAGLHLRDRDAGAEINRHGLAIARPRDPRLQCLVGRSGGRAEASRQAA